jgi:hypothetical protein
MALLGHLNQFLRVSPRGPLLDAVLEVAQDRSASIPARVNALLALTRETHPRAAADYRSIIGRLDADGASTRTCFTGDLAGDTSPTQLSQTDMQRVRQVGWGLYRDKTQPLDVRSAAACIIS